MKTLNDYYDVANAPDIVNNSFGHLNSIYVKQIETLEDKLKILSGKINNLKNLETELFPIKKWTKEDDNMTKVAAIEISYLADLERYNKRFSEANAKLEVILNHIENLL